MLFFIKCSLDEVMADGCYYLQLLQGSHCSFPQLQHGWGGGGAVRVALIYVEEKVLGGKRHPLLYKSQKQTNIIMPVV